MKPFLLQLRLFLAGCAFLAAVAMPVVLTSCTTPPSARVVQVQTLKAVGQAAEASVALSAQLYRDGRISVVHARQIIDLYDAKFQPAFRLAVTAAGSNLDSAASPDLATLASELANLVASYTKP